MFMIIVLALIGLILGEPLFHSPLAGLLFGVLGAVLYDTTQKVSYLEEKVKDQEEIIDNLLDRFVYPPTLQEESIQDEQETESETFDEITPLSLNLAKNEESVETLPIDEIEAVMASLEEIDSMDKQTTQSSLDLMGSPKRLLIGDNPLVRIGGIILFLGLSFFAKFLIDQSIITLEMRLAFIGIVGIGMIALGWRWREKEGDYGLILQAIGVAALYLDIFSSAKLYGLIDLKIAFILMLMLVLIASWLSIIQKSLPLILFSITGGFLVPILTSDGSGSHIMLFSYYALLNLAIVIVAYFYSWRILNLVGFAFTFIIATWWGVLRYEEELFATTEPFLILFIVFYLTINVLFSKHLKELNIQYVDTAITFGLPFIAFVFQDAMIGYDDTIMALSAFVLALIYGVLSFYLQREKTLEELSQSFFALMVIFATFAIGYTFEGEMLSTIWAIEAVGTIWIALKQNRVLTRTIALLVMGFALLVTIENIASEDNATLFSIPFISALLVFAIVFAILWLYHHYQATLREWEKSFNPFMAGFGLFIYQFIAFMKFDIYDSERAIDLFLIFTSIVSLILMALSKVTHWQRMQGYLSSFLLVGSAFILFGERLDDPHPFYDLGIIAFPLFFTSFFTLAYYLENEWEQADIWQIVASILLVMSLSFELYYHARTIPLSHLYQDIAWGIMALIAFGVVYVGSKWLEYPFKKHLRAYNFYFLGLMSIYLTLWSMMLFAHVGSSYIPLLNLLDIIAILTILSLYYYIDHNLNEKELAFILLGLYGLIFISVLLARSMHSFGDVAYNESIIEHLGYQMGLSILWSVVAFILMILSQKLQSRGVWIASMSLIGVTVLKLLFVDLSNSGTLERIISFIGAGVLILIIGYFFKLPERKG